MHIPRRKGVGEVLPVHQGILEDVLGEIFPFLNILSTPLSFPFPFPLFSNSLKKREGGTKGSLNTL